jgi:hypothetical protein
LDDWNFRNGSADNIGRGERSIFAELNPTFFDNRFLKEIEENGLAPRALR